MHVQINIATAGVLDRALRYYRKTIDFAATAVHATDKERADALRELALIDEFLDGQP
jgi:hypothetical protein